MTTVNISPLHGLYVSTPASEQALQLFAQPKLQRPLSRTEITELSWLHYRHRTHGNARTTWRDYEVQFRSTSSLTEGTCKNRWTALRDLAIRIRMLERWDFDSRRTDDKAKRYLQFTQTFYNFPWAEVIGQAEAEAKEKAQQQSTDPSVAALLRWRDQAVTEIMTAPTPEPEQSRDPGPSSHGNRDRAVTEIVTEQSRDPLLLQPKTLAATGPNPDSFKPTRNLQETFQETLSTPSKSSKGSACQIPPASDLARLLEGEASSAERSPRSHGPAARAHLERSQPSSASPEQPEVQHQTVDDLIHQAAAGQRKPAQPAQAEAHELSTDYQLAVDEEGSTVLLNPNAGMLLMLEHPGGSEVAVIESVEYGLAWIRCSEFDTATVPVTADGQLPLSNSDFRPLTEQEQSCYSVGTHNTVEIHE